MTHLLTHFIEALISAKKLRPVSLVMVYLNNPHFTYKFICWTTRK